MVPSIQLLPACPTSPTSTTPLPHPPTADLHPSAQALLLALSASPHTFLQPPPSLHTAALVLAKRYLDPLALSTSDAHARRLHDTRKKRKRGHSASNASEGVLRLKQIHTEGFEIGQIWEQARRVLDASRQEVERCLPAVLTSNRDEATTRHPALDKLEKVGSRLIAHDEDALGVEDSEESHISLGDELIQAGEDEAEAEDEPSEELSDGSVGSSLIDEVFDEEARAIDIDPGEEEASEAAEEATDVFIPDKNGLNDGFFSIDDFNKHSEFLEQQDARGEPNNDATSDEEDIDWDADPIAAPLSRTIQKASLQEGTDQESDDEEDAPTFGNADLHAPDTSDSASASDVEDAHIDSMNNTNDIKYADFFAPPARKAMKSTRLRALPKTQPPPNSGLADTEDDIQRTISAVRRDIFEDDDLSPNEENLDPHSDSAHRPSKRSNHETRQAQLAAEIRRLEAANVAKRDWTLSGEARAADRPVNSLLEEDLDFERVGKPVPVITNEVSEDIEALIKRRILAREFDEVIRRRPGDLVTGTGDNVRRGRFELDDSKPQQSLAEIYEAEHLKTINPETYVDPNSEKVQREVEAVETLWKDISAKLDGLCSLHYRPKPPQATITVVSDVPAITLEDARPSAGAHVAGTSMLAPQEVYVAGENQSKASLHREVVLKSGKTVNRDEMSQDDRKRRRRRAKERIRKRGGDGAVDKVGKDDGASRKSEKGNDRAKGNEKEILGALKKGGVRVIGKGGEVRDVGGKIAGGGGADGKGPGGGGWKL